MPALRQGECTWKRFLPVRSNASDNHADAGLATGANDISILGDVDNIVTHGQMGFQNQYFIGLALVQVTMPARDTTRPGRNQKTN